ncbi:hypothetical protein Msub_10170 [Marinobacter subterrani]|uniref:GpE family phage tail protein n=1 Tax=Marinobacter subterrani TaxID=1658765 RepID=A0A0J7J7R6_9GAMM|nr:hypothetical protein Msub_10170 [Marinobacter subterrani]
MPGSDEAFFAEAPADWAALVRSVAVAFTGFSPLELLEMDLDDLVWWYHQAEQLAEEMKANG